MTNKINQKTVELSLNTILRECSKDPRLARDHFYYFSLRNRKNIHDTFSYKKFNDDFTDRVTCYNDGSYIIGIIRPSYDEFLDKLLTILNMKHNKYLKDDDNLTQAMLEKIEVLKKIQTENELKKEFPVLYKDLIEGRSYIRGIDKLKSKEENTTTKYANEEHYYYSCGLKRKLSNFLKCQVDMYTRYIMKRKELKEKQENTSYNKYLKENINLEKLYMYVIHEYLKYCEDSNDLESITKYITLIERYLESDKNKSYTIITDENVKVTEESIKTRLSHLKRRIKDQSEIVNWIIIPKGKEYSRVSKSSQVKPKEILFNYEEIEQLRKQGERKKRFYEGTDYIAKVIGLLKYQGYVAYIYENGEVLTDTEYDTEKPTTAIGNAIYNIKACDFISLSKLDKKTLKNHPRVKTINHTATWEARVEKIIEKEATEEAKESAKVLIKELKNINKKHV